MEIVPISFNIKREDTLLSIITVTGISKDMPATKEIMLGMVVKIIDIVETKYKGKAIESLGHENDEQMEEGMLYVKCYLLFKNERELGKAVLGIKKELG